jgi:triacylglycerol lipase
MLSTGRPLVLSALLFAVTACSGDAPSDTTDSTGSVWTGVSGAGGGHAATASHSGVTSGGGGMGGAGGAASGAPYPVVLAHGFFGFNDFAGAGFLTYFYGVKDYLAQEGRSFTRRRSIRSTTRRIEEISSSPRSKTFVCRQAPRR